MGAAGGRGPDAEGAATATSRGRLAAHSSGDARGLSLSSLAAHTRFPHRLDRITVEFRVGPSSAAAQLVAVLDGWKKLNNLGLV